MFQTLPESGLSNHKMIFYFPPTKSKNESKVDKIPGSFFVFAKMMSQCFFNQSGATFTYSFFSSRNGESAFALCQRFNDAALVQTHDLQFNWNFNCAHLRHSTTKTKVFFFSPPAADLFKNPPDPLAAWVEPHPDLPRLSAFQKHVAAIKNPIGSPKWR